MIFKALSDKKIKCLLCPRYCEIDNGSIGYCSAIGNIDGEYTSNMYGSVSAIAIEPIEKKPFVDFLPGTKTLSIGSFGCNLRCVYCENCELSHEPSYTSENKFSVKDIIYMAIDNNCSSVCMTYSEPTIHFNFLVDLGEECQKHGLKLIIKTNAYINMFAWEKICSIVDAVNIDYKGPPICFEEFTGGSYPIYDYNKKIYYAVNSGVHVEVSIPLPRGYAESKYRYSYFSSLEASITLEISRPFHCHILKLVPANKMIDDDMTSDKDLYESVKDMEVFLDRKYIHV